MRIHLVPSPSLGIRVLSCVGEGVHFHQSVHAPRLADPGRAESPSWVSVSQLPSARNSPHAQVAGLGAAWAQIRLVTGGGRSVSIRKLMSHVQDTERGSEFAGLRKSNPESEPRPRPGVPAGGEEPAGTGTREAGGGGGGRSGARCQSRRTIRSKVCEAETGCGGGGAKGQVPGTGCLFPAASLVFVPGREGDAQTHVARTEAGPAFRGLPARRAGCSRQGCEGQRMEFRARNLAVDPPDVPAPVYKGLCPRMFREVPCASTGQQTGQ